MSKDILTKSVTPKGKVIYSSSYISAFHATNDKKTADELTLKMDLMIDIIEILNKFNIEDISTDKLLNVLEILERERGEAAEYLKKYPKEQD